MPCTASGVVGGGGVMSLGFEPRICDKELTSASDSFFSVDFLCAKPKNPVLVTIRKPSVQRRSVVWLDSRGSRSVNSH